MAGGVQATAKHFPGFGAADVNSDDAAVSIGSRPPSLRAVDEPPFGGVIAAGARLLMLANAMYPALDPARAGPLSRAIATTECAAASTSMA